MGLGQEERVLAISTRRKSPAAKSLNGYQPLPSLWDGEDSELIERML